MRLGVQCKIFRNFHYVSLSSVFHAFIIPLRITYDFFRKRKLLGSWKKTTQTGSSGASLLLHNTLRAFKFPDESQIYLKCDIEVRH